VLGARETAWANAAWQSLVGGRPCARALFHIGCMNFDRLASVGNRHDPLAHMRVAAAPRSDGDRRSAPGDPARARAAAHRELVGKAPPLRRARGSSVEGESEERARASSSERRATPTGEALLFFRGASAPAAIYGDKSEKKREARTQGWVGTMTRSDGAHPAEFHVLFLFALGRHKWLAGRKLPAKKGALFPRRCGAPLKSKRAPSPRFSPSTELPARAEVGGAFPTSSRWARRGSGRSPGRCACRVAPRSCAHACGEWVMPMPTLARRFEIYAANCEKRPRAGAPPDEGCQGSVRPRRSRLRARSRSCAPLPTALLVGEALLRDQRARAQFSEALGALIAYRPGREVLGALDQEADAKRAKNRCARCVLVTSPGGVSFRRSRSGRYAQRGERRLGS